MANLVTIEINKAVQAIELEWSNGDHSIVRGEDEITRVFLYQRSRGLKLISITGPVKEKK